ncbi:hypothetical protein VTL71DRAFT_7311 [Oculimacula yallundae]|uniref:Mid2 domain-containing protein n=1 Tax=Oculimacula yallundae TaxID=86028 RepID=A0ABR4BWB8_9HELO
MIYSVTDMASKLATTSYFLLLAIPFLTPTISAQASNTCFVLNGRKTYDSGYRCNNATTGHSACCGEGATCYSNGLCEQFNGPVVDYLRVGCTDPTWQDPACLNQCASVQNFTTAGLRFCGASVEASTSYCCDDGTQGVGSFHCCESPLSIFRISPAATVLAQIPLSQLPTSTSSASQTSTSATTSSAPVTSTSALPSDEGHPSTTVIVGAAMGVSGTLIILGLIGFSLWRRRRDANQNRPFELQDNDVAGSHLYRRNEFTPKAFETETSPVTPMGDSGDKHYEGAHQRLPDRNRPYELGA